MPVKCKNRDLFTYQCGPAAYLIRNPSCRGLALLYKTGYGKTLAAVAVAMALYDAKRINKIVFISPKSLLGNLEKGFAECGGPDASAAVRIIDAAVTYETCRTQPPTVDGKTLLICDEAHRLRDSSTGTYQAVHPLAMSAHAVLLLTATPFSNSLNDFINLMHLIRPSDVPSVSDGAHITLDSLQEACRGHVAFTDVDHKDLFPERRDETIYVELDPLQVQKLEAYDRKHKTDAARESNAYLTRTRQLSLGIPPTPSSKILKICDILRDSRKSIPALIFSDFISGGVMYIADVIRQELPHLNVQTLTGKDTLTVRQDMVNGINSREIDVLIGSQAAAEGLDFKGGRSIILSQSYWTPSVIDQMTGRFIRKKSHTHLPKSQQFVTVYRMVSTPPYGTGQECVRKKGGVCTEMNLFQLEQKKRHLFESAWEAMMNVSIPHVCDDATIPVKQLKGMCSASHLEVGDTFVALNGATYQVILSKKNKKRWMRIDPPYRRHRASST
jgi:superfamily II DNA or RNA helicase